MMVVERADILPGSLVLLLGLLISADSLDGVARDVYIYIYTKLVDKK